MTQARYGALSAAFREDYRSVSKENTLSLAHQRMTKYFDNPVTVSDVSFTALDDGADSIRMTSRVSVKNEVKKIGSLYAFSIPFTDMIFTTDILNADTRTFDFEYWDYETVDRYETDINITLPETRSFAEVPQDKAMEFKGSQYAISFKLIKPNVMKVTRRASINRSNIAAVDFNAFKTWASEVMEMENTYITFK